MKRSEVNEILRQGEALFQAHQYHLPEFANWTEETFAANNDSQVVKRGLGWDITDFGINNFAELGLFLFTVRNGDPSEPTEPSGAQYAEKIMILRDGQACPMHRHVFKTEDIINRGGAELVLELYASKPDGSVDRETSVQIRCDGALKIIDAGTLLKLEAGASVTLTPGIWHAFWVEGGDGLIGEVSTVNDDKTDNIFEKDIGRFSSIEEDEQPYRLLVSDYGQCL